MKTKSSDIVRVSAGLTLLAAVLATTDPTVGGKLGHTRSTINSQVPQGLTLKAQSLDSCQILNRRGTKYVLSNDVSSPGTCFSVQADNITLDLNRHSIVYGTGARKTAAFGVLGIACWDTLLTNGIANDNTCGGHFDGLTVLNGKIVQAPTMAPFSDAIHLGQGGGDRLQVFDVEVTVQGDSAIPIYTNYSGAGSTVRNNIVHNKVRTIQNRHQLQGMTIKFDNSQDLRPGQTVSRNKILGGAQGGIVLLSEGATAHENEIRQDGHYSNDFAIYMWGNREQVYNNVIDAISGRGIQIGGGAVAINGLDRGGKASTAHHNSIQVIELKQNCDGDDGLCKACQPGGAYGIQFDDNPLEAMSFNNTVLARGDDCDAGALRVTDSRDPQNASHDDNFRAVRVHPNSPGHAYGWDNAGPTSFVARNDVFAGDTAAYHVNWDGAQNEKCISCTFAKGTENPSPDYVTFSFQNGGLMPVKNIHFLDAKFVDGARKDSTDMKPILSLGDWPGPSEYFIDWTVTLFVHDSHDVPISANISLTDALGHLAFQGSTNAEGKISAPLTEFRTYNSSRQVVRERHSPYRVTISNHACGAVVRNFSIEVTETTSTAIEFRCGSK